ncbi:MAG TPA: cyclic pyranopterin monophosphate synthase MoaC [Sediminispirochaeta sp.]|nr:cyclic pyranopterin monophosphate synthase MoaC [Sediminispirochaeta sp.]
MGQEKRAELSHTDHSGKARMVEVGHKEPLRRRAKAAGRIHLQPETVRLVRENLIKKGDVLTVAEIAGIQGAKQTHLLIPLCHPLPLTGIDVVAELDEEGVEVTAEARCTGPTGVEMEALTAVQVALLTVYDMCKAVDQEMRIENVHLLNKTKEALS